MNIINGLSSETQLKFAEILGQVTEEIYKTGFEAGKLAEAEESVRQMGYAKRKVKSANQQRADLIEKAKKFVKRLEMKLGRFEWTTSDNATQIVIYDHNGMLMSFGHSRCAPADIFNKWIGKAIALGRALMIDIPLEFFEAVQPTKKVIGMKILDPKLNDIRTIEKEGFYNEESLKSAIDSVSCARGIIIDDTNAKYEVAE